VKLAFNVFDIKALAARLEGSGVKLLYPPRDTAFSSVPQLTIPTGILSSSHKCARIGLSNWTSDGNQVAMWCHAGTLYVQVV